MTVPQHRGYPVDNTLRKLSQRRRSRRRAPPCLQATRRATLMISPPPTRPASAGHLPDQDLEEAPRFVVVCAG